MLHRSGDTGGCVPEQDEPLQRLERLRTAVETALRDAHVICVRRWFVNGQRQTMLVMPNPAADKNSPIVTLLAIASHEVTLAEFLLSKKARR